MLAGILTQPPTVPLLLACSQDEDVVSVWGEMGCLSMVCLTVLAGVLTQPSTVPLLLACSQDEDVVSVWGEMGCLSIVCSTVLGGVLTQPPTVPLLLACSQDEDVVSVWGEMGCLSMVCLTVPAGVLTHRPTLSVVLHVRIPTSTHVLTQHFCCIVRYDLEAHPSRAHTHTCTHTYTHTHVHTHTHKHTPHTNRTLLHTCVQVSAVYAAAAALAQGCPGILSRPPHSKGKDRPSLSHSHGGQGASLSNEQGRWWAVLAPSWELFTCALNALECRQGLCCVADWDARV